MQAGSVARIAALCVAVTLLVREASAITMAPTAQGFGPDDFNISTLMPATYITASGMLSNALTAAGFTGATGWNFAFAGVGPAAAIANIPATDFTLNYYQAWVVTNDPIPNGTTSSNFPTRPVMNQDAGGADFVLTYTPRPGTSDPVLIHFIQAFTEMQNGAVRGNANGNLDAPRNVVSPYYDLIAGAPNGTIGNSTWMRDIPFTCESGALMRINGGTGCGPGVDETILSRSDTFNVFVVGATTVDLSSTGGSPFTHIIYGGEQWGYTYTNSDTPEPGAAVPLILIALTWGGNRLRRVRARR